MPQIICLAPAENCLISWHVLIDALSVRRVLPARALAVRAPWPAAGPTLAFFQLLLRPANAAFSGHLLLGILDPADELVAGQGRDVLPGIESRGVGDQRLAQVSRKFVHHSTGHSRAAHWATVAGQGGPYRRRCLSLRNPPSSVVEYPRTARYGGTYRWES
jgi:hypothetical protein